MIHLCRARGSHRILCRFCPASLYRYISGGSLQPCCIPTRITVLTMFAGADRPFSGANGPAVPEHGPVLGSVLTASLYVFSLTREAWGGAGMSCVAYTTSGHALWEDGKVKMKVIAVAADGLAPYGARSSACTVMTNMVVMDGTVKMLGHLQAQWWPALADDLGNVLGHL